MSDRDVSGPDDAGGPARFGVRFGGVALALPPALPLVFLDRAMVHPLAGAPGAVAGLTQLQGHPLVVLEAAARPAAPAVRRCPVLVIGSPAQGAALRVDEAPVAIMLEAPLHDDPPGAPGCAFGAALRTPWREAPPPHRLWWTFDAPTLLRLLGGREPG